MASGWKVVKEIPIGKTYTLKEAVQAVPGKPSTSGSYKPGFVPMGTCMYLSGVETAGTAGPDGYCVTAQSILDRPGDVTPAVAGIPGSPGKYKQKVKVISKWWIFTKTDYKYNYWTE